MFPARGVTTIELLISISLLLAGFYVGWNIGANDAANCIGPSVGSGIISYRRAVILMIVCMTAGAVFQGHYVMETIGKGIVICDPQSYAASENVDELERLEAEITAQGGSDASGESDAPGNEARAARVSRLKSAIAAEIKERKPAGHEEHFPEERLPDIAIFVALISAGLFVTLATFSSVPVSTSQAIVGGVLGVGVGMAGFDGAYFQIGVIWKILACWMISPFLTLVLAFLIYGLLGRVLRRFEALAWWNRVVGALVILSACYVSYSLGMNNVGNAIGPLLSRFPDQGRWLAGFSGFAIALGALTFGRRVTDTVGKGITPLDLTGALSAQLSSATGIYLFSVLGIPVSTSMAIVGAIIGVGLVKGSRAVSRRKIVHIVVGWVGSPLCAAVFAALVYRLIVLWIL
jgi:inorganic phosphate transporter, PiT family